MANMRKFRRWLSHALRDVQAWIVNIVTIVAGAGAQFLAGLDAPTFLAMPGKEKALRVLIALAPDVLLHIATARQHQDADAIVAKLKAKGVIVATPVDSPSISQPPEPPGAA